MEYSNITLGLENLTQKNVQSMLDDMENYKLLESNPDIFLKKFFRKGIGSSLFIRQIQDFSSKAVYDFHNNIFIHIQDYLKQIIGIEGIVFSVENMQNPLVISIFKSDIELVKIHIYDKKVEVLEEYFFKDINTEIEKLESRKSILLEEYSKHDRYALNSFEILKDNENVGMLKSVDIALSSMKLKKNKYKEENRKICMDIESEILDIDTDINELLIILDTLKKNLLSISYYQNRIVDRLSKYLGYTVFKN